MLKLSTCGAFNQLALGVIGLNGSILLKRLADLGRVTDRDDLQMRQVYVFLRRSLNIFRRDCGYLPLQSTERRTMLDFAHQMKWLVDERYPEAEIIEVILDNLNTHKPAPLYEAFEPAEARRILRKINFHYTPKHGSWLNMAEIELSILQRQCLDRRIPDEPTLKQELSAWEERRNEQKATIDWQFSLENARTKLKRLYPSTSIVALY